LQEVERYYEIVRRHLEDRGLWAETVRRFPPGAIRSAIRDIIDRLDQHNIDPETLDWGTLFEALKDYEDVDGFIRGLEQRGYIPRSIEETVGQYVGDMERYITEMMDELAQADPEALKRIRGRIMDILGEVDEVARLKEEVGELKKRLEEERWLRKDYSEKLKNYEELNRKLRREIEELRRGLEEARRPERVIKPTAPPTPSEKPKRRVEVVWVEEGLVSRRKG
jgi:predicted RNase H-like nuclease (RuvC/YqgF family)